MAGVFQSAVLTQKGIALLTKAQAGRCTVQFSKAQSGNGAYSAGEEVSTRMALKSVKQTFPLRQIIVQNASTVFVKFVMTNKQDSGNLITGYYVKEIGLFAIDPDEGEILYAIAIGVENQWDYMPAYNDLLASTITVDFLTEVSNAETVTIEAPDQQYIFDDTTGDKYVLGINNGLLYYEEVEG